MVDAGQGLVRLITLAPERDADAKVTRMLTRQGVTVAAGHCDASLDDLNCAVDAGLTLYTHLGNGCPMQMHRHDNIVQRVLSLAAKGRITPCFIADGVHVPFFALANYLQLAGADRTVVVTDAISAAGLGPGRYTVSRWDLLIGEDMVARSPDGSHFVGSAITMPQTIKNLTDKLGLSNDIATKLITTNARRAVGL
jgi:N-acetylglucosamine-6-phosphate deacetylase